jgi:signal transduction histidine kinase
MRKLFLKVYLPLAICIVMTLILSVLAIMKIIPAQLNQYRENVEEFRNYLLTSHSMDMDSIITFAESMDLEVRVVPNTGGFHPVPSAEGFYLLPGMPREYPWRIEVSGGPRGGPGAFLRQSFWLILLILLITEGLVLFVALWPVRKRLAKLQWAASELGSGSLGIKLHVKERGDLIDDLGGTFNSMAERMRSLIESHQELLGIVAHELRTPMARMRLALELIKEDSEDSSISKIERMEKDLIDLDNLVTELLDFNKLRRENNVSLERVDLAAVCNEVIHAESWAREDIDIQLRGNGTCMGNISLLGRAIGNLVRNAVRYAKSKVIIDVSADRSSRKIRISIADDGSGYDSKLIDRLGEPFTKGHSSNGTGLGLAITSRIVSLHSGRLLFGSSAELGGAEAVVELNSAS